MIPHSEWVWKTGAAADLICWVLWALNLYRSLRGSWLPQIEDNASCKSRSMRLKTLINKQIHGRRKDGFSEVVLGKKTTTSHYLSIKFMAVGRGSCESKRASTDPILIWLPHYLIIGCPFDMRFRNAGWVDRRPDAFNQHLPPWSWL